MYNIPIVYLGVSSVNCLKCGREIEEGQVFCNDCLVQMAKYPVKPGTAVQLPSRGSAAVSKKVHSRRRTKAAPEEQLEALKKRIRRSFRRHAPIHERKPSPAGAELLRRYHYCGHRGKLMFHVKHFAFCGT